MSSPSLDERIGPDRRKLGPWDTRVIISIPAFVILLVIAMGFANYRIVSNAARQIEEIAPGADFAPVFPNIQRNILIVLVVFTLLALVSSLGMVWSLLRPIHQLTDTIANVAKGNIPQSVQISAGFELNQRGHSFTSMINYLETSIQERETYLSENILGGSVTVDPKGRVTSVNAKGLQILGAERSHLVGKTFDEIQRDRPAMAPSFMEYCKEKLSMDTSSLPVEIEINAKTDDEKPLSVAHSLLRDASDIPLGLVFNFRDTSRIENLQRMFSRTDQLAALGTFTMGLSHELRNPLGALKGTAQLLTGVVGDQQECKPYLDRIVREVDRLDGLIRELYDFSRTPGGEGGVYDLNDLARDALMRAMGGAAEEVKADKTVREQYAEGLPKIGVQRDRTVRAIVNVILNGLEHTPKGGRLGVETSVVADGSIVHPVLDVTNTGPPILEESLRKVFEPFYSTKPKGMGLGLAIAYQIVAQNKGTLKVFNTKQGVDFQFVFPNREETSPIRQTRDA